MDVPLEVDVATAARLVAEGALLLDVREPDEVARCSVPGSRHVPMRQIPAAVPDMPSDRRVLVLCHLGVRSRRVTQFLRERGLDNVSNVAGGIDAWAEELDPTMARY